MLTVLLIILGVVAALSLSNTRKLTLIRRFLQAQSKADQESPTWTPTVLQSSACLTLVLPCHGEFHLARRTITAASRILKANPSASVLVITDSEKLTKYIRDVIAEIHGDAGGFMLQLDLTSGSTKRSKLQLAMDILRDCDSNPQNHFIGMLDFDVWLHPQTVPTVLALHGAHQTGDICQQVPYPDFEVAHTLFSKLWSIAQVDRCLLVEAARLVTQRNAILSIPTMRYLMGASLFIRFDRWLELGIPASSDDIALGYRADLARVSRLLVPLPAKVEPPTDFKSTVSQLARIFRGVWSYQAEIQFARQRGWIASNWQGRLKSWLIIWRSVASDSQLTLRNTAVLSALAVISFGEFGWRGIFLGALILLIVTLNALSIRQTLIVALGDERGIPSAARWTLYTVPAMVMNQAVRFTGMFRYLRANLSPTFLLQVERQRTKRHGE